MAHIGERPRHDATIHLADYDPAWPETFADLAHDVRAVLGDCAVLLEHAGSTSVPGLAAKPIIDIVLEVPDSTDEAAYVPALESLGYVHRIREPDWFEHRLLRHTEPRVNLHVFSADCPEVERMLAFRDWLRRHPDDRRLYESAKRELAKQTWAYVQDYADAKSDVVQAILARALPTHS